MLPISRSVFELLNDALNRRKTISFDYHAMGTNSVARRSVEPYGLFFLSSHWYLAGRDVDKAELRNFRLNRMHNPRVNSARQQSADYTIPRDFSLREHARSKQAWELGDGNAEDALVDFNARTGAARAASQLGVAVGGAVDRRKFTARRIDAFARWLLSFGGEAIADSSKAWRSSSVPRRSRRDQISSCGRWVSRFPSSKRSSSGSRFSNRSGRPTTGR